MVAFSEVCFSASGLYLCCVGLEGDPPEGAGRPLSCLPSQPLLGGGVPTTPQSLWSEHAPGQVWVMRPPPDRWRERPESLSSPSSSPHRGLCPCPSCWGREGEDEGGGEGRFTSLLKDMIKDTDEQLDEGIHKVRSGSVLSAGASVSSRLGVHELMETQRG